MGNNSLRRILEKETKWTDKTAKRHKHKFTVEACVQVRQDNYVCFYHVMKCEFCNSFHSIREENNISGFVSTRIPRLPLIKLYNSHKTFGFNGAVLDE